MDSRSRVYVAGNTGMVGSAIVRMLHRKGYTNIFSTPSKHFDLRRQEEVERFFEVNQPEYVYLAAAKVGGILANRDYPAHFIYDNLMIQSNIIESARKFGVKKLLFLGSSCIYPKECPQPIKEEYLLTGPLEPTNDAYAIAKISGIKMLQAYRKQYGFKSVSLMPSNLYGIGDNFHPDNGHVIPAMMTKFSNSNGKSVTFWGDGTPMREFLYADDLADACLFAMDRFENAELINVGSGENVSIESLARTIAGVVGYHGNIEWDTTRPNGTPKRPLDYSKMTELGWNSKHSLHDGLKKTYQWFIENTYYDSCK